MLVTGGAGFIGCNFVRYMLKTDADIQIVNLDALTYAGSMDNLKDLPDESRHTFVHGDICDRPLVDSLLRDHKVDTIVHFAAESHVDNSIAGPEVFIKTNVMGTYTLLEAARHYWLEPNHSSPITHHQNFRFHHISTDEVYGTLGKDAPAFTEATPYAPNSPYSASKAGSDHLVRAWFHTYGLPVTTTNCSNNYGPYQHGEKLIPTIIRSCREGKPIPVYGDGSNIRDWLYVEDHCSGIDAVIRRGRLGEVYNIGGCNEWTNINIVKKICSLMDEAQPEKAPHAELISFVTDRPGHDWRYAIDANKMADELAWQPAETFETGIRKTVEWVL
jgi:dTDP-glucose 4,6-dehydratase